MDKITSSPYSQPPILGSPQSSPSPFSQSGTLGKITRVIAALLLILVSLGLILIAYNFSDLLNYRFCVNKKAKLPIPIPESTKIAVQNHGQDLSRKDILPLGVALQTYLKSDLPILDNSQIFQFMCVLHDQYPRLLPDDCLVSPLTIFNYQEEICNTLQNKLHADKTPICPLKASHPLTCSPKNYHRLLRQARVLPFLLWYDPEPTTYAQTLEQMQKCASQGSPGSSHWTVIIVDLDAQLITYFDSLSTYLASRDEMKRQITNLALHLATLGICKNNKTPFDVRVIVEKPLQTGMGLCCGLWCCQYMKWYMEDPKTEILKNLPDSLEYKNILLHSLFSSFQEKMTKYTNLSWPTA